MKKKLTKKTTAGVPAGNSDISGQSF